jgi:hypothetical protein
VEGIEEGVSRRVNGSGDGTLFVERESQWYIEIAQGSPSVEDVSTESLPLGSKSLLLLKVDIEVSFIGGGIE